MQFRILGSVEFITGGESRVLPRRRERCLLGVLLLHINQVMPAGRLVELLWDGEPPDAARPILSSHVSRVRGMVAAGGGASHGVAVVSAGGGYQLTGNPQLVDAHRFRALVDQATRLDDPEERLSQLGTALGLWRGAPLADAASEWLRSRLCLELEEQRLAAVEHLVEASLALGRGREVLPELARTAGAHPGHERLVARYMQALHQAGRKAEALAVFARTRFYLADELGLDPGQELREAHQAVLRDEVAPAARPDVAAAPAPGSAPQQPMPRQLPAAVTGFSARARDLLALDQLTTGERLGAEPVTCTITGPAGVGKTALAVYWAHRASGRFPDGQLYVNLRGFDPAGVPLPPVHALHGFLDALGVPPQRMPADLDGRTARYRTLLAGRRMLILLDNAADAEQVRPLLPGTPGCPVLVTSRNQLAGLVAAEGATPLTLDPLPAGEAHQLLRRRLGERRVAAEPEAAAEIVARCAGLPLALVVVAARAALRPSFALQALADELRLAGPALDGWGDPGTATDLRSVFSWSYRALGAPAARVFRLLGLHPGAEISVPAAASLTGLPVPGVRRLLTALSAAHLVSEVAPGRYGLHDLLRAYAAELAGTVAAGEARVARRRMLDHYLGTAHAAAVLLNPHRQPVPLAPAQPGAVIESLPDHASALAWFAREQAGLVAAVDLAGAGGFDTHCWQLAWALSEPHQRQARWPELVTVQRTALAAARRIADPAVLATVHRGLAAAYLGLEAYEEAHTELRHALEQFRAAGDRVGEARAHLSIDGVLERQGQLAEALEHARRSLALCRAAEDLQAQAHALKGIGWLQLRLGDHQAAVDHCRRALALLERTGDRAGQAMTWHSLGYAYHELGTHEQAASCYARALELVRGDGDRYREAYVLDHLGDTHQAAGDEAAARAAWRAAADLLSQLDHPDREQVHAKLG